MLILVNKNWKRAYLKELLSKIHHLSLIFVQSVVKALGNKLFYRGFFNNEKAKLFGLKELQWQAYYCIGMWQQYYWQQ